MFISRTIQPRIQQNLSTGKAVVIYGPRQIGKTTLVKQLIDQEPDSVYLNCDEPDIRTALTDRTSTELKNFIGNKKLVVMDEAQRVKNIGITLKLLVDNFQDLKVVATGSSAFSLSNQIAEPLTGRTHEFHLYPLSITELSSVYSAIEVDRIREKLLIFGSYPEVVTVPDQAQSIIENIARNYLYKDVLEYQDLRNTEAVEKLLQALALQLGSEVSYTELANLVGLDYKTVEKYIRVLEQAFVIFRLTPFSRNLRKELSKKRKIFFWDCGVRNALIRNFNPLSLRNDQGALWENFLIAQRIIAKLNQGASFNRYFWRMWGGREIDYVEEQAGALSSFEIKFGSKQAKAPPIWRETYPQASFAVVNQSNWQEFLRQGVRALKW